MENIRNYIDSGIIEMNVLGMATPEEQLELKQLSEKHLEINVAIHDFELAIEKEALANALLPDPLVKAMVMATVDFTKRMQMGEPIAKPPVLGSGSNIADYAEWLSRPDMLYPATTENIYIKIIAADPSLTTAIVWIKNESPEEVHHDELESFLIVEGTCTITIGNRNFYLVPGDYLGIPLHEKHSVKVTSTITCKVILQRAAA